MTYKHTKFDESEIMRSFEDVAVKKGLVKKQQEIKKTAEKNLYFTENLSENILKLCENLRQKGLETFAEELEFNFLNYKKAQTLYETSKETGEDLINDAHPEGSHKLESVSGDSVVETILDRRKKIIETIDKKPTGKLSNSKDIVNAIKNEK